MNDTYKPDAELAQERAELAARERQEKGMPDPQPAPVEPEPQDGD